MRHKNGEIRVEPQFIAVGDQKCQFPYVQFLESHGGPLDQSEIILEGFSLNPYIRTIHKRVVTKYLS